MVNFIRLVRNDHIVFRLYLIASGLVRLQQILICSCRLWRFKLGKNLCYNIIYTGRLYYSITPAKLLQYLHLFIIRVTLANECLCWNNSVRAQLFYNLLIGRQIYAIYPLISLVFNLLNQYFYIINILC